MAIEDDTVYATELQAFAGTPLGDLQDRSSLILETREMATECPVLVGQIHVVEGRADMTSIGGYAKPARRQIVFAPRLMGRYLAVHEVAHIVHYRLNSGGRAHGPEYRGVYVDMVEIVYGERYGELLRHAFYEAGVPAALARLPKSGTPIIDIDALTEATRKVRWI